MAVENMADSSRHRRKRPRAEHRAVGSVVADFQAEWSFGSYFSAPTPWNGRMAPVQELGPFIRSVMRLLRSRRAG